MCTTQLDRAGQTQELEPAAYHAAVRGFARQALRTLGFACKAVSGDHQDLCHQDLCDLTLVGLQGMIDPPKPAAIAAVAKCQGAGIRTVMVTGDHPDTAQAVAAQLGIRAGRVLTGVELANMDLATLRLAVEEVAVFARVAPEHKKLIAEAFQANGHVVAMTGDGVNDAPALRQADIGIAMGIAGTEVAREAADMVLADDNFATIVNAVEEGRHAWTNLRKAILYTLPTNAAQALLIMGAILLAALVPVFAARFVLEPVQILWINLIDSVLLTLPLMMEPKERGLLARPPRDPQGAHHRCPVSAAGGDHGLDDCGAELSDLFPLRRLRRGGRGGRGRQPADSGADGRLLGHPDHPGQLRYFRQVHLRFRFYLEPLRQSLATGRNRARHPAPWLGDLCPGIGGRLRA
jgi:magnesium-transporting ATPase (P-type)